MMVVCVRVRESGDPLSVSDGVLTTTMEDRASRREPREVYEREIGWGFRVRVLDTEAPISAPRREARRRYYAAAAALARRRRANKRTALKALIVEGGGCALRLLHKERIAHSTRKNRFRTIRDTRPTPQKQHDISFLPSSQHHHTGSSRYLARQHCTSLSRSLSRSLHWIVSHQRAGGIVAFHYEAAWA